MQVQDRIAIRVNGETRQISSGLTIAAMLAEIGLDPRKVAVERHLEIGPRSTLGDVPAEDGDAFEIVHFVGGG